MQVEFADEDELVEPGEGEELHYDWDVEFQRHIIALLLVDKQFLLESLSLVRPSYFTNKVHRKACQIVFDYYERYKHLPNKTTLVQEIKDDLQDDKAKLYYLGELNTLFDYFQPGLESREYLSDKITYFAKIAALKEAFRQSLKLLDKAPEARDTWDKIYERLRLAMNTDRNLDHGLFYFKTLEERYDRMHEEDDSLEKFHTPWPGIDQHIRGGGYNRGEMITIVSPPGVGKSVALTCLAATNVQRGKKCVYISLELSEDRVAERFDAILTNSNINCLYDQKDEIFETLHNLVEDKSDKDLIIIKYFQPKAADVNTIRSYISQLKFHGYVPDLVIVDYIGEMKDFPDIPIHESRELITSQLRGLANEGEKFFLAVAMQPNRGGKEVQKTGMIDGSHLGDSYGQLRPVDGALSLNQNESEAKIFVGKLNVMKQRFGRANYFIPVKFDQETLKITEITFDQYKTIMSGRVEEVSADVMIDKIVKEYKPSDAEENTKGE